MEETKRREEPTPRETAKQPDAAPARPSAEVWMRACRGPLADGSCRMPEETCNNPTCPARG